MFSLYDAVSSKALVPARGANAITVKSPTTSVSPLTVSAVDGIRQMLQTVSRSLTALGNSANALFAQVSATLAMERANAAMAAAFGKPAPAATPYSVIANPFALFASVSTAMVASFATQTAFANPAFFNPFAMMADCFSAFTKPSPLRLTWQA